MSRGPNRAKALYWAEDSTQPHKEYGLLCKTRSDLLAVQDAVLKVWQGDNRLNVELAHVKGLVAALVAGAADLAEVLAAGGEYHA